MNLREQNISLNDYQLKHLSAMIASLTSDFERFCLLDSHDYKNNSLLTGKNQYRLLAGLGMQHEIIAGENPLVELQSFLDLHKSNWYFGHLNYDLKNTIEPKLNSSHTDYIGFSSLSFFIPEFVIEIKENLLSLIFTDKSKLKADELINQIKNFKIQNDFDSKNNSSEIHFTIPDKQNYLQSIEKIKYHLHRGDIYELNFCLPFIAENVDLNSVKIWNQLSEKSPAPLSCFYKLNDRLLMSSSPERFIRKEGNKIYSQPIKGTARRSSDKEKDFQLKADLIKSEKERSENIMIVDLVRNDLSCIAKRGTVNVEELFGMYEFPQVFQLISTISAEIKDDITFTDILKALFPMGSMTGAPKISAMKLIEEYENFQRGLFSGAIGYISPDGDFDFNVIIRSIFHNESTKRVMIAAGSAITYQSDPESEYEECLLKAKALLSIWKCDNLEMKT